MSEIHAVLLAAGTSSRYGGNSKLLEVVAGRTVLEHSFDKLAKIKPKSFWVVSTADLPDHLTLDYPHQLVQGGSERQDSVVNALIAMSAVVERGDKVLIHDAARPCVTQSDLGSLISKCLSHPVGGFLAAPVTATLKRFSGGSIETVNRDQMFMALTPQLFDYHKLSSSLASADAKLTDDAQALERCGHEALLINGCASNIKITYPGDLAMAQAILQRQMTIIG